MEQNLFMKTDFRQRVINMSEKFRLKRSSARRRRRRTEEEEEEEEVNVVET